MSRELLEKFAKSEKVNTIHQWNGKGVVGKEQVFFFKFVKLRPVRITNIFWGQRSNLVGQATGETDSMLIQC